MTRINLKRRTLAVQSQIDLRCQGFIHTYTVLVGAQEIGRANRQSNGLYVARINGKEIVAVGQTILKEKIAAHLAHDPL